MLSGVWYGFASVIVNTLHVVREGSFKKGILYTKRDMVCGFLKMDKRERGGHCGLINIT